MKIQVIATNMIIHNRKLIIYTWGKKKRDSGPNTEFNFDATVISGHKSPEIKELTGLDPFVQERVRGGRGYTELVEEIVRMIELCNFTLISINCKAGKHRSVSCAEILKSDYYPKAKIVHLELAAQVEQ